MSGLTANQIVAAVVAMGIGILLWMIDTLGYLLPDPFDAIVTHLSLVAHFTPFATGALFLSDVGFFLTIVLDLPLPERPGARAAIGRRWIISTSSTPSGSPAG